MNIKVKDELLEIKKGVRLILKSKKFYLGLAVLLVGIYFELYAQSILHSWALSGKNFPQFSDVILDNIPYWKVSFIYDWVAFLTIIVFVGYVVHKKQYNKAPYFLLLLGLFEILRSIFILLTPIGNPPGFEGADSFFNGFSRYELGVYPSGHTGGTFIYVLLSNGIYRYITSILLFFIIAALFLARGHYTIDVLSGLLFSYALYSFAEKYLKEKFTI